MNTQKFNKAKAGLLLIASPRFKNLGEGLSRGTYHERKQKDVDETIASLQDSLELVHPGIIYSREDMEQAMKLFYNEKVDFIVANFLSWSEDFAWIRFLRDMPEIPILFVNIAKDKVSFGDTLDEDDFIDYLCAGTLVGSLEGSGSVPRTERKNLKIVMGSKAEIHDEILSFAKVAWVRSVLRNSTLGLLANYNEAMWSTYIDPYNLFTRIGPELRFITYTALNDEINKVTDAEVKAYKAELESKYPVMDDVDDEKFYAAVRGSLGLAKLTERMGIDIMVFNDIDVAMFELIGHRPSFYPETYERIKSVLVPEADMGAGVITYVLKLISGKRVNFIEPFHIEAEKGTFAGGHAGPNDHTDPDFQKNVIISRDVRFAKTKYKYAGAPFAWYRISAGLKTMVQLVEDHGKYKLVCTLVESLEGNHLFATYSHSIFRPLVPVKELFEKILKIGTTQHFAIADGDYRKELSTFAEMMGFEYYEIA
jgi:L-arabinose isomerase